MQGKKSKSCLQEKGRRWRKRVANAMEREDVRAVKVQENLDIRDLAPWGTALRVPSAKNQGSVMPAEEGGKSKWTPQQ